MIKTLIIIFLCVINSSVFSQVEFKVKVEDYLFWNASDENVRLHIFLTVRNIGNESGNCEDIYKLYLECSQPNYKYDKDIIFDILSGDLTINIEPDEVVRGRISFIVPLDADNLTLKFPNDIGGSSKIISDSYEKWMEDNTNPYYYIRIANDSFSEGNYYKTYINCLKAQTIDSEIDVNFLMASASIMLGWNDKAIKYFQRYLEDNPGDPTALNNIGWSYFEKSYYDDAIRYFERSGIAYYFDDRDSETWDCYLGLAVSYLMKDDIQRAKDFYYSAAKREPLLYRGMDGLEELINYQGYFYTEKDVSAIKKLFKITGH